MHMRLLACQIAVPAMRTAQERDRHNQRVADRIDARLERRQADLVALPELSGIDYSDAAFGSLATLAESLDGPSFEIYSALARRHATPICYGIARCSTGAYFITQVVVGSDGERIGYYDKIHLAQLGASRERESFVAGHELLLFEVAGLRIAPLICYDLRFPELWRRLCVSEGATLILHAVAFARDETYWSWHHFVIARALENQVYCLSLNRAGSDYGGSLWCPPWCDADAPPEVFGEGEELRLIEFDPHRVAAIRERYPLLRDRRTDYADLPVAGR